MRVILLLGASSTGKSSLCGKLAENHQCKLADTDEFHYQAHRKAQDAAKSIVDSLSEETQACLGRYGLTDKLIDFPIKGELNLDSSDVKIHISSVHDEAIEKQLEQAGIAEADIPLLATCLRDVATQSESRKEITSFWGLESFFNAYLEDAFSQTYEPDDTLILDVNPHEGFSPAQILDTTEKHIEAYTSAHQDQSIDFFKVLAYCPPAELSRRLRDRRESGYTGHTATGLYSYEQLSMLIDTVPKDYEGSDVIDTLSSADIEQVIDNSIPEASRDMAVVSKTRHELVRIFKMDGDSVKFVATREFPCDAIVNTSKADAETLANTLVDDINECAASRRSNLSP